VSRRQRLDAELVRRRLVTSRTDAAGAIAAGRVLVNGAPADKPARLVDPGDAVVLAGDPPRYVGRGGRKLEHALDSFGLDPTGCRALDVGASTGGFTDCLLQHGAAEVIALDVGHGQLHPKIRDDQRVHVMERCNVRAVAAESLAYRPDFVVVDVSFISLTKVVPALVTIAEPNAALVLLVKPQFEAGRADVGRGRGVITDPAVRTRAVDDVVQCLVDHGATVHGTIESPITGADGNVEYLCSAVSSAVTPPVAAWS
jgi:23S rRNA (cytidine1920-2'-O)/16S rRNA (cytidine1409-2'-O)-methyltransferase